MGLRMESSKVVYSTSASGNVQVSRSPPLPTRSPLRPRATSATCQRMSHPLILSPESVQPFHTHALSSLSESTELSNKKLSVSSLPDSPSPLSPVDVDDEGSSTSSILNTPPTTVSKRTHALLELLSSERAYASDLALIRDIHIPLALGQPSPFNSTTVSPYSSGSSSRTLSTASDSSSSSTLAPAMTIEDTKIIFTNISDLALFSDVFTGRLEEALGSVLEGGRGQDHVGALFLEMIPALESPYKQYITRHPTALEHLSNLPKTPPLTAYLQHIRTLASSLTHAWDLPSLLIKPVQRLLKYSLLLTAIIDGTPDDHADKLNLKIAKEKMDEVARGVNEGRRRREVVKEVLMGGKRDDNFGAGAAKKKGLNIGVAASVSLGKVKGLRNTGKLLDGLDGNEEKEQVERMEDELKQCEIFIRRFAKQAMEWGWETRQMMCRLSSWTESFGRVIGISEDQVSESFDAFRMVVDHQILLLCDDLETVIKDRLLTQLAVLINTMMPPSRLLEAMHTLEPLHYGLLNLNISRSRPPPALLDASQSYVALRGQLFVELPQYLASLHKGIVAAVLQLGVWQGQFWGDVRERWEELWEALKVDGEMNVQDAPETVSIWWERFSIIDVGLGELDILKKTERASTTPLPRRSLPQQESSSLVMTPQEHGEPRPQPRPQKLSTSKVLSILSSLEPAIPATKKGARPPVIDTDPPPRKNTGRRPSDASKRSRRNSFRFGDDFDFVGTPPDSPSSPGSLAHPSNADQIPVLPIRHQWSKTSPTMEATSSSPPHDRIDEPREHSRSPNMRRKLTEPMDFRRTPSLPSLTKSKSFGFSNRSSSHITQTPNGDHALRVQPTSPQMSSFSAYVTPVMYECEVITAFDVGRDVTYEGIPFHRLKIGNRLGILQEAGHPCTHPNLPIHVDDGEDCLLMARNIEGAVGWVFASFLIPVD